MKRELSSDSESDEPRKPTSKVLAVSTQLVQFTCSLPPKCLHEPAVFSSMAALESHHRANHAYTCAAAGCGKVFPDERFLELHLSECHDPLQAIKSEQGKRTFRCFEARCDRMFANPKKRRLHLIDAHKYPKEFFFALPLHGLNQLYEQFGEGVSLVRKQWTPRNASPAMDLSSSSDEDQVQRFPRAQSHSPAAIAIDADQDDLALESERLSLS